MFTIDSIHAVSDFSRKPAAYIKRLKETGSPEILTVNGKAEIVVQDARAYEEMIDLLDSLEKIVISAKQHDKGNALPAAAAFSKLEERLASKYPDANF